MTKEEIGAILKSLRVANNMTQKEVAEKIGRKQQIVGHWETGYAQPDANTLFSLCELYGVSIDEAFGFNQKREISAPEYEHIKKYRMLSVYDKETVDMTIDRLINKPAPLDDSGSAETIRIYPYLHNVASAGAGDYIADIPLDSIEAPYIKNADFVIGVCGDSMEPDYHSGEKLYVQKTDTLNTGDIGIFKKDGSLFLKEAGTDRLISHNGDYPDVYADSDNISVVGKVLGKVE